jgi:hypothetical protein
VSVTQTPDQAGRCNSRPAPGTKCCGQFEEFDGCPVHGTWPAWLALAVAEREAEPTEAEPIERPDTEPRKAAVPVSRGWVVAWAFLIPEAGCFVFGMVRAGIAQRRKFRSGK